LSKVQYANMQQARSVTSQWYIWWYYEQLTTINCQKAIFINKWKHR